MKTIVVPTDLSVDAACALSVAVDIASNYNATILLLHTVAYPVPVDAYPGGSAMLAEYTANTFATLDEEARESLQKLAHDYARPGVTIEPRLLTNGFGLVRNVTEQPADLIVLFSSGTSGLAEWVIGSNAEAITRDAHCPVLVVKEPVSQFQPSNIVFAIDIDERLKARDHYPFGMGEQGRHQFLYVLTPTDGRQPDGIRDWVNEMAAAKGITEFSVAIRHARSIPDGVIDYADDTQADLIVLYTHGRKGLAHLLTGSVAEDVLNHAKTPVLIMRLL